MWKDKFKRYNDPEVTSSDVSLGRFRLTVHRHIHYPPETWLASCHGLFDQRELRSPDVEVAKQEALGLVEEILNEAQNAIQALKSEEK